MKFANLDAVYFLLALPVFLLLLGWSARRRQVLLKSWVQSKLWSRVLIGPKDPSSGWFSRGLLLSLAVCFLVLALARPQWGQKEQKVATAGLDVFIAFDVSSSMEVEDMVPSRIKKARHFIKTLLEELKGDRVGVVAFARTAYMAVPLTEDLEYVYQTIQILGPQSIATQGTNIASALYTARMGLERAGGAKGDEDTPQSSRAVILITDGEDHEEEAEEQAIFLRKAGISLFVVGVGTQKGGPVPVRDSQGNLHGHKRTRKGEPVISKLNVDALEKLAGSAEGHYLSMTEGESEVNEITQALGKMDHVTQQERVFVVLEERYQWPLGIAVFFLVLEILWSTVSFKMKNKTILLALGTGTALSLLSSPVFAEGRASGLRQFFENRDGLKALGEKNLNKALEHFKKAEALDPENSETTYNRGTTELQAGDKEAGQKTLSEAIQKARKQNAAETEARALNNLGTLRSEEGKSEEAVTSYLEALQRLGQARKQKGAESNEDQALKELEATLRKNIERLSKQQEDKKNENQKDQKNESDPNKSEDQKENQDPKDGKEDSKKGYSQNKKWDFNSNRLSKEDAERVMNDLNEKEKELRGRVQRNAQGKQKRDSKDDDEIKDW